MINKHVYIYVVCSVSLYQLPTLTILSPSKSISHYAWFLWIHYCTCLPSELSMIPSNFINSFCWILDSDKPNHGYFAFTIVTISIKFQQLGSCLVHVNRFWWIQANITRWLGLMKDCLLELLRNCVLKSFYLSWVKSFCGNKLSHTVPNNLVWIWEPLQLPIYFSSL